MATLSNAALTTVQTNLTPLLGEDETIVFTSYGKNDHPVVITTHRLILVDGEVTRLHAPSGETQLRMYFLADLRATSFLQISAHWLERLAASGSAAPRPATATLTFADCDPVTVAIKDVRDAASSTGRSPPVASADCPRPTLAPPGTGALVPSELPRTTIRMNG